MFEALAAEGARITLVLACPYHAEAQGRYRAENHPWRKPNPGMLLEAARHLPIELDRSWIVGDHLTDIIAGRAAGLAGGFHVLTGHGARHRREAEAAATPKYRVIPVSGIGEVATYLFGAVAGPARSLTS
jgi:D-glycero-D-manno-heptose 1,7-bisphosphate phosphatase